MFGGGLEWRPRPTPSCSAIEEEEEEEEDILTFVDIFGFYLKI
jgi:hypothetical protein